MESKRENLWAPWRLKYVTRIGEDEGCIFCSKPKEDNDKENLILYRGETCYIIMNLYPYNNGHLMVIPYRHLSDFTLMTDEEMLETMLLTKKVINAFKETMNPNGFNTGYNLGRAAGAGIDAHIHFHIVPRWNGDSNFMPVIGETKVISQHIGDTYDILYPILNRS